ncbi:MAG: preprotein translocase subunit SecG [Kiritimatiellae bacterium]|nr:preprotein translocase subunit SecG [Kiritimatiellia bacterium]MDW8459331.1 preprotein translocase subunit SecG [Verrucomicrobiota bacterium]
MGILRVLLILVEVVTCFLLIAVILIQKSKSEGLGLAFGAGVGETLFGSRAGNVLTKITVTLGLIFLANTALLGMVFTQRSERSLIDERFGTVQPPIAPVGAEEPVAPGETPPAPQTTLMPGPDTAQPETAEPIPSAEQAVPEAPAEPETVSP